MKKCMGILTIGTIATLALLSGCATYVDTRYNNRVPEDKVKVENPQPVHLQFQFKSMGSNNNQATTQVKNSVFAAAQESGLFSRVDSFPVSNGATLNITIDNQISGSEFLGAMGKGLITGLTFWIIGNNVRDRYECMLHYLPEGNAPQITRRLEGGLYTGMGLIRFAPKNARKTGGFGSMVTGVNEMAYQVVADGLNEIAKDPNFARTPTPPQDNQQ